MAGGEWAAAVEALMADFGRLDILVNNAALLIIKSMLDTTPEELLRLVKVNQLGPYLGIRAVTRPMRDAGGGSIVNVCSTDGVKGMNGVSAYASTKWALRGITKSAAMELARDGIRVNGIAPGLVRTRFSEALWKDPEAEELLAKRLPLGRIGEPEDLLGAEVVRASKKAVELGIAEGCSGEAALDILLEAEKEKQ